MFSPSHKVIYVWVDPGGLLMPPPTGAGCSHAHPRPITFGLLPRMKVPRPPWETCSQVRPPCWGLRVPSLHHPLLQAVTPHCQCVPACWDSLVPSTLPSPLQQPLAVVYCLFSLWCLILPQVKCQIIGQRQCYHPAMKKHKILNRLSKKRYRKINPNSPAWVSASLFSPVTSSRTFW